MIPLENSPFMIKNGELIERFGDVEFLHELWVKARLELPQRLAELRSLSRGEEVVAPSDLSSRLHKLRGLISNFLTEERAVELLISCEDCVEENKLEHLPASWNDFERVVNEEIYRLDSWLTQQGYPVRPLG